MKKTSDKFIRSTYGVELEGYLPSRSSIHCSICQEIRGLRLETEGENLLVTLPATSLAEPDTVDFGAVRAAREEVICSMAEKQLNWWANAV